MKILFDHQIFEMQKFGGISRYYFELLDNFQKSENVEWELPILYTNNEYLKTFTPLQEKLLPISKYIDYYEKFFWGYSFKGKRFLYRFAKKNLEQPSTIELKTNKERTINKLKEGNFDIFHPTYYDSYFLDFLGNKPFVLTVYDLIHQIFPEIGMYEEKDKNKRLLDRASRIIAISESTKRDIVSIFDVNADKIIVTHLANSLDTTLKSVSESFVKKLPKKYFLFVGGRDHYKNFLFFVQMFTAATINDKDICVVCSGAPFSSSEMFLFNKLGVKERMFHSFVSDAELTWLYKNAMAYIFPSLYEGFGLPVLEAFSCGCPVLSSYSSSLTEIGEDAVIYFEPKNPKSMLHAIKSVIQDKSLRNEKITKGFEQLKKFSWQKAANETENVYQQIL